MLILMGFNQAIYAMKNAKLCKTYWWKSPVCSMVSFYILLDYIKTIKAKAAWLRRVHVQGLSNQAAVWSWTATNIIKEMCLFKYISLDPLTIYFFKSPIVELQWSFPFCFKLVLSCFCYLALLLVAWEFCFSFIITLAKIMLINQ